MSLPREWNLQDSRGSFYCPSEPDPTGRIQYKSGRFIRSSTGADNGRESGSINGSYDHEPRTNENNIGTTYEHEYPAIVACSQPAEPSLLTECQQSSGSLFSIVSAPPMPIGEFDVKQVEAINIAAGNGLQAAGIPLRLQMGGSAQNNYLAKTLSTATVDMAPPAVQRRPATLPIDTPYCPATSKTTAGAATTSRTLHSSLLEHQISEIEEDDNENLLTVSSITARPLIAKSREICLSRQLQVDNKAMTKRGKQQRKVKISVATVAGAKSEDLAAEPPASSSQSSSVNADPPDGGYGWFIVFGAFSVQFWVAGLVKSYGVLNIEIRETFPNASVKQVSWVPAILSALCLALAPLSSALCQRFSCRAVVFVGGLFCASGMILSYFATNIMHLLFTFGILTGIGGGLSTTPGIVIVSQYFDKHRALANGICVSGTAAGSFILPVLIKHLAEKFGFHGTILILGGCMLHVCVSATLYKPIEVYMSSINKEDEEVGEENESTKPLNDVNPSSTGMLTGSTYLDTCEDPAFNHRYIEHLFLEESKNRLNDYYSGKHANEKLHSYDSDDEFKDIIGETTFIKPMKKVRSSGIMHSVEDLSTDSTWVYRKHSGTDSNRGSRRRRHIFANDELISKIQAHLEQPLSPPAAGTRGLSKSMEIPTPVSNLNELKQNEDLIGSIGMRLDKCVNNDDDFDEDIEEPRTCCERIEMYLDITLLKDPIFILMCMSVVLMSVGCPYMLYYLPSHVLEIGYGKDIAGYLVAVSAVFDLCGRLGLGWLSDLQIFDRKNTYFVCILGAGIAVLMLPSAHSLRFINLAAALYGFCLGSWYVLMPVLLADIFGTDRISSSYGLVRMFQSIGAISVPPLAGYIIDITGDYIICFYCMGTCMVMGCFPFIIWTILERRARKSYSERDSDENSMES